MNIIAVRIALVTAIGVAGIPSQAEVLTFECQYPTFANEDSVHQSGGFRLTFKIDTLAGKAFVEGNNGLSPVDPYVGGAAITFSERLDSGAIQSTTLMLATLNSVHSRHTVLGSRVLSASQYYGICAEA